MSSHIDLAHLRSDHTHVTQASQVRAHARGEHTQSTVTALPVLSTPRCGWRWRCRNIICTSISRICPHTLHQHSPSDSLRASHHIDLSSHAVSPQRSSSEYPHRCPPSAHPPHPHALLPRAACLNPGRGGESPLGRRGRRPVDAPLKLRPTLRAARPAGWPPRPAGRGGALALGAKLGRRRLLVLGYSGGTYFWFRTLLSSPDFPFRERPNSC